MTAYLSANMIRRVPAVFAGANWYPVTVIPREIAAEGLMTRMTFENWKRLITSPNAYDRSFAADELPEGPQNEIVRLLVECLNDSNKLARACAADTLGALPTNESLNALRVAAKEESNELALSFILSSLGSVGNIKDIGFLVKAMRGGRGSLARLHATLGLGFCSLRVMTDHLLRYIERKPPNRRREAAANSLGEYLSSHKLHVEHVRDRIQYVLKSEKLSEGEKSTLEALLQQIEEDYRF